MGLGARITSRRARAAVIGAAAVASIAVISALPSGAHGSAGANAAVAAGARVDVELAIDGTGSMSAAIDRARNEAVRALVGVKSLLPNARFAVVVFRDRDNPAGEYQLLQPLTSDEKAVERALARVQAHKNPTPGNTGSAESYNLAFQRSYSDPKIGWDASARKILVVLGDAEPNGAGKEGLPGCKDATRDPHGLSTRKELANMRKARRTLIMIRMPSGGVTTSLQCYASLAAGAFVGGAARDAGADIATLIVSLIKRAVVPLTIANDLRVALRNTRTGYTITLPNPNATPLRVRTVRFAIPAGFRYLRSSINRGQPAPSLTGRALTWALDTQLAPNERLRMRVVLRAPARVGRYRSIGSTRVVTADGRELVVPASPGVVSVQRRLRALTVRVGPQGTRGRASLSGAARFRFGRQWHGLPAAATGYGRIVVISGSKRVILEALQLRLESVAAPSRARLFVRVAQARGYARCRPGTRGTLAVTDTTEAADLRPSGAIVGSLPRGCGGRFSTQAVLGLVVR